MAKRKGSRISPQGKWRLAPFWGTLFFKTFLGLLVAGMAGFFAYTKVIHTLRHSEYLKVRMVEIDPSLSFINQRDLEGLKGKSMLAVNLKDIQRKLAYKYPQVTQLKIVKRFPDRILVLAKKRLPFAQTVIRNRTLTLDDKGVVLSSGGSPQQELPMIVGVKGDMEIRLGIPVMSEELRLALRIMEEFRGNPALASHVIKRIDVGNLLQVYFYLSNDLKVIVDRNETASQVKMLGFILSQGNLDVERTKYIDLRFKEPIIGKK